jgi:hypothetical protein
MCKLMLMHHAIQDAHKVADTVDDNGADTNGDTDVDANASTDNYPGDEELELLLSSQATQDALEVVDNVGNAENDYIHIVNNAEGDRNDTNDDNDSDHDTNDSNTWQQQSTHVNGLDRMTSNTNIGPLYRCLGESFTTIGQTFKELADVMD